jgi:hypothetical protein
MHSESGLRTTKKLTQDNMLQTTIAFLVATLTFGEWCLRVKLWNAATV